MRRVEEVAHKVDDRLNGVRVVKDSLQHQSVGELYTQHRLCVAPQVTQCDSARLHLPHRFRTQRHVFQVISAETDVTD